MSIAVWTNSDNEVTLKHYKPEELEADDYDYKVESDGTRPDIEGWQHAIEHYTPTDGFYYEIRDATDGLSDDDVNKVKYAINDNNYEKVEDLIMKGMEEQ